LATAFLVAAEKRLLDSVMYDARRSAVQLSPAFHLQSQRTLVSHFFRQTVSVSRLVTFKVNDHTLNLSVREI
jgi:hypothetical protein